MATILDAHSTIASLLPPPSFLLGLALGSTIFVVCFRLSPIITKRCGTPTFVSRVDKLDDVMRYNYHTYLPSTIHAVLQVVGTFSFIFLHQRGEEDGASSSPVASTFDDRIIVPYGPTHLGPAVYMGVFVGYLLSDMACAPSFEAMGYPFVLHHLAASACWTFCAYNSVMQRVGCLFQFNEVSTPLMNLRQYLLTAGYRSDNTIVIMCSLAFFTAFGLARVAPLPYVMRDWVYRDYFEIRDKVGPGGAVLLSVFFAVNAVLQVGWFYVMCRKLVGMMTKKKRPRKNGDVEEKKKAR